MYILFLSSQRKLTTGYIRFKGLSAAGEASLQASWGPYPFRVTPAELQSVLPVAEGNMGGIPGAGLLASGE